MNRQVEHGVKWWFRYVIVPIVVAALAGGGIYAILQDGTNDNGDRPTPTQTLTPTPTLSGPRITLTPDQGPPGTLVQVYGGGFPAGVQVQIVWRDGGIKAYPGAPYAKTDGSISFQFTVYLGARPGTAVIEAYVIQDPSVSATDTFLVQ